MASIYDWSTNAPDNATADADINWAEGQPASTVNNSAREMMAKLAHFRNDLSANLITGGTGNNYTITPGKPPSSLANGWYGIVRFDRSNSYAPTMQVGGLPSAPAPLVDAEGNQLRAGFIEAGGVYEVVYNVASGEFRILNKIASQLNGFKLIASIDLTTMTINLPDGGTVTLVGSPVETITISDIGKYEEFFVYVDNAISAGSLKKISVMLSNSISGACEVLKTFLTYDGTTTTTTNFVGPSFKFTLGAEIVSSLGVSGVIGVCHIKGNGFTPIASGHNAYGGYFYYTEIVATKKVTLDQIMFLFDTAGYTSGTLYLYGR